MRELSIQQHDIIDLSNQILNKGGKLSFKAHGSSMLPFIKSGDVISLEPVAEKSLTVGTIVLYKSDQTQMVAHRVVKRRVKNGQIFLSVKGDAHLHSDQLVTGEQIIGKITEIKRDSRIVRFDRKLWPVASSLWRSTHPIGPLILKMTSDLKKLFLRLQKI